jgi:hypothetical protein
MLPGRVAWISVQARQGNTGSELSGKLLDHYIHLCHGSRLYINPVKSLAAFGRNAFVYTSLMSKNRPKKHKRRPKKKTRTE